MVVVALLEDGGQDAEEGVPAREGDGVESAVEPAVEPALGYHVGHVAVLVEKEAASIHVGAEEGGGCEGHRHHFGGREAHLGIVVVGGGLQELLAQAVEGGYGIFQCVLPVPKVEWPSYREDIVRPNRGQLGLLRDGGHLYAATNGIKHMHELVAMLRVLDPEWPHESISTDLPNFNLHNGAEQLSAWFNE